MSDDMDEAVERAKNDEMGRAVLETAAQRHRSLAVFRHYARLHSDKRTDDGDLKAARNRVMGEMCHRAFAAASTDKAETAAPPAESSYRCFHCEKVIEAGETHRHSFTFTWS